MHEEFLPGGGAILSDTVSRILPSLSIQGIGLPLSSTMDMRNRYCERCQWRRADT